MFLSPHPLSSERTRRLRPSGIESVIGSQSWKRGGRQELHPRESVASKDQLVGRREEAAKLLPKIVCPPRIGHELTEPVPHRFCIQPRDAEDQAMLVIPRAFKPVMQSWIYVCLPRDVKLSANKSCAYFVLVQDFNDEIVLGRGRRYFVWKHKIKPNNIVILKLPSNFGLKFPIYEVKTSTICRYRCMKLACQGLYDLTEAI